MKTRLWSELNDFVRCCHVGLVPDEVVEFHIEGTFWREEDAKQAVLNLQQFRKELHSMKGVAFAERDRRIVYAVVPVWKRGRNLGYWWLRLMLRELLPDEPTPNPSWDILLGPFEKRT